MPRIFDNIEQYLRPALADTMRVAHRADFCVGYFNLRGWRSIDADVQRWPGGEGRCCRILVGMQRLPHEELRAAGSLASGRSDLDNQTALRLKKRLAGEFREQLTLGAPTNQDEAGLRRLARQLNARKDLYALCTERSLDLLAPSRWLGFIVQAPIVSTQRMSPLRELVHERCGFSAYATFDDRPSKLFNGMHHCRVCIVLCHTDLRGRQTLTTKYHKWYREERSNLLALLHYQYLGNAAPGDVIPKLRSGTEQNILRKALSQVATLGSTMSRVPTDHRIYYKITGVGHWFTFTTLPPRFWRAGVEDSSTRESSVCFSDRVARDTAFCCLWSTLHYWLYQVRTNCRDFNPSDLESVPIPDSVAGAVVEFGQLSRRVTTKLERTSEVAEATYDVGGRVRYQRFRPKAIKGIIDEIDRVLAVHYGFSDKELDFIINYDIKYRMGRGTLGMDDGDREA